MDSGQVHFELFVRRRGRMAWELELATWDRRAAFEAADQLTGERGAAVRLFKETQDPATGAFRPLVLLERGETGEPRRRRGFGARRPGAARTPPASCAQPRDLYATPAREAIGRLLGGWLARHRVTPFELLHRADLAERLEACEAELSAALYNAALAEAAARGVALEPVRQGLDTLARRAIERVISDDPDVAFRLGAAVASRLGRHTNWKDKLELVLDLLDAAPEAGQPASVSLRVLQQPLIDILGGRGDLDEILGSDIPLGDQLMILTQIASAPAIAVVVAGDASLARSVPRLKGLSARLALVLHARPVFARARRAIGRRVLAALALDRPLWPGDPAREVEGLKALACLLSVSGRLVDQEAVASALAGRWRRLSGPGFVDARLALCKGAVEEVDVVLDLLDAAVGRAPQDALGRRLVGLLLDRAFEQETRFSPDPLAVSLRRLAALAGRVRAAALRPEARAHAERRLRGLAAALESDASAFSA